MVVNLQANQLLCGCVTLFDKLRRKLAPKSKRPVQTYCVHSPAEPTEHFKRHEDSDHGTVYYTGIVQEDNMDEMMNEIWKDMLAKGGTPVRQDAPDQSNTPP